MAKNIEIRNNTAEFLIFQLEGKEDGVQVMYQNEIIWCTQKAMAQLFECSTDNLGLHLKNIYESGELMQDATTEYFSSRKDDYDAGLWEHFSHLLAKKAGINAAETRAISTNDKYHTLLSRRFDRREDGKRIHFASAMTLLGLNDGDNANTGNGYLDMVDFILQNCTNVEDNLKELYRRVAFNICIGNTDDHFRNHGFLLTAKEWTLSPAYDMNPSLNEYQSLLINSTTNKSDLNELLNSCEEYMHPQDTALQIISEVLIAFKYWRSMANQLGILKPEQDIFYTTFERQIRLYNSKS